MMRSEVLVSHLSASGRAAAASWLPSVYGMILFADHSGQSSLLIFSLIRMQIDKFMFFGAAQSGQYKSLVSIILEHRDVNIL